MTTRWFVSGPLGQTGEVASRVPGLDGSCKSASVVGSGPSGGMVVTLGGVVGF